jgi:cell division protein FtsL
LGIADLTRVPAAGAGVVYARGKMAYSSRFSSYDDGRMRRPRRNRRRGSSWRGPQPRKSRRVSLALPPDVALLLVAGLIVGGLLFVYIRQGTLLRSLTAEHEAAREELTQLEEINHSLEIQVEQGFSLQRLSRYATEQLGMVAPTEVRYVHVPKDDLR